LALVTTGETEPAKEVQTEQGMEANESEPESEPGQCTVLSAEIVGRPALKRAVELVLHILSAQ
jgi:hypothetical protein